MMNEKRTAFVVGATGFVGEQLVAQLCAEEAYGKVVTFTRRPLALAHTKLEQHVQPFEALTSAHLANVDDVFCCLGTTLKKAGSQQQFKLVDYTYPLQVASYAQEQQVRHVIVISAMWANPQAKSFYTKTKGELEQALGALQLQRLSIVRPSLLIGPRQELRLGEKLSEGIFRVLQPILRGPLLKMRPIAGETVASAMINIALSPEKAAVQIYEADELVQIAQ